MTSNVDLVRSIYATWERGEFSTAEWAHPEIECVMADGPAPGRWTGPAGMTECWRDVLDAWEDFHAEAEEYRDLDRRHVLVLTSFSARGRASGLEVAPMKSEGAALFHLEAGRVNRVVLFRNRERALVDLYFAPDGNSP
jgi:hypothetical protein